LRYFTPALDAQPNNTILMKAISFVKRRQAKFQESRDLLVKCSELDPQAWRTWFELAYNELVMRQYRSADEHLKRALLVSRRKSTSLAGIHSLIVFSMNGDVKAAHDVYDAEVDETTSWLYRLRNCQFHMAEGNLTAARNDLSRSALGEVDIDSASYFLSLGTLDKQTGSPGQARARFDTARGIAQHAVLRNPKDFIARSNLGLALAYLGDKAGALEQGKKAVELMPLEKDPLDVGPQMLYTLVQIYAITGDSDSAIDTLDRLLSIPNIYSVRFVELDPDLKSLNSSPRFQKMLEKYRQAS
jgi:tetratricopeptide (TPR) repeat protein